MEGGVGGDSLYFGVRGIDLKYVGKWQVEEIFHGC